MESTWWCVGDRVEARYTDQSRRWKPAKILQIDDSGISILFDGFNDATAIPDDPSRIRRCGDGRACKDRAARAVMQDSWDEQRVGEITQLLAAEYDAVEAVRILVRQFPGKTTGELGVLYQTLAGAGFQKTFEMKINHVILMNPEVFSEAKGKRNSQKIWMLRGPADEMVDAEADA